MSPSLSVAASSPQIRLHDHFNRMKQTANVPLSRDPLILSLMPQLPPLARFKLDVLFIGTVINQSPFFPSTSVLYPLSTHPPSRAGQCSRNYAATRRQKPEWEDDFGMEGMTYPSYVQQKQQ